MAHVRHNIAGVMAGFAGALAWCAAALATPAASPTLELPNAPPAPTKLLELPGAPPAPASPPAAPASPMPDTPELKATPAAPIATPPAQPPVTPPSVSPPASALPAPPPTPPAVAATLSTPPAAPAVNPPASAVPAPAASPPAHPVNPAVTAALSKAAQDVLTKNPGILFEPVHLGNTSLLFSKSDMDVLAEAFSVYDNLSRSQKTDNGAGGKDDLTSLLDSIKSHGGADTTAAADAPPPLPNLYLGSIVYYSPSYWSIWINGKKLMNKNNLATGEFYVSRLSRLEVELIWKPQSLQDLGARWQQMTGNGAHALPGIQVDASKGRVILLMRPNQTFLPRSLAIREGLIKSSPVPYSAADTGVPISMPQSGMPPLPPTPTR